MLHLLFYLYDFIFKDTCFINYKVIYVFQTLLRNALKKLNVRVSYIEYK